MYLLDTNVVSELRKPRPHGGVVAWIKAIPDSDLYVSVVTLGEIQTGIEMTRKQDPKKAAEIESWTDQVAASYNVLSMDSNSFRLSARLMHRHSDSVYEDAMTAATALVHQLTLATRNVRAFKCFQVQLLNPFERDDNRW